MTKNEFPLVCASESSESHTFLSVGPLISLCCYSLIFLSASLLYFNEVEGLGKLNTYALSHLQLVIGIEITYKILEKDLKFS